MAFSPKKSLWDRIYDGEYFPSDFAGWNIEKPRGTMYVWGAIPEHYRTMGSLEFAKLLVKEAKVVVSPGIGFGEYGDEYVRFALVENQHRINQAVRGIRRAL